MAHKSNLAVDDIASESSSSSQEAEYNVEEILAERLSDDSSPRFLVRWENYPDERCDSGTLVAPSIVEPLIPFSSPC
jgi:Chromo (CHRromatin Organisation MOdifier) domain